MSAPGGLAELGASARAWEERVAEVIQRTGRPRALAEADTANATELRVPDWPAVPARIRACLGRRRADQLFDVRVDGGDAGRSSFQEEYAEWRVVRNARGSVRFELTTELSDYWELLARHAPRTALDLVAAFAREDVSSAALFGDHDPFAATSTEDGRAAAFAAEMLGRGRGGRPGPYNNGAKAIVCLSRSDNTLDALVGLVIGAADPQLVIDPRSGEDRFPSASEAIPAMPEGSAQDCRNSDPVVVERIVRLATEGRPIRFDDPVGVYVLDVQVSELLCPDGEPLPPEWVGLGRQGPSLPDGLARHQRVELEIPEDAGFTLAEVRGARTGLPIEHGAQIAELVQLGVYLRVGDRDSFGVEVSPRPAPAVRSCAERPDCAQVHAEALRLEKAAA